MPEGLHTHFFGGRTSYDDGHMHRYSGITTANPDLRGHTHYMAGYTTVDSGHTHYFAVSTGPEIETYGGHYHNYRGITRMADRHVHSFSGTTSISRG